MTATGTLNLSRDLDSYWVDWDEVAEIADLSSVGDVPWGTSTFFWAVEGKARDKARRR